MSSRTTKAAIGYIRVSTTGQAIDGVSLDAQRAKIAAYCELHGLDLADVFADNGVSAKRADNRPGLQRAIAAVCKSRGVLVVYSLSRFARSTRDAIDLAEQLRRSDADLVSLSEDINTTSAAGKMIFRLLAVLAEFERDLVSERTTAALAHKRRQGERISRFAPFGFDLAGDGRRLEANAHEQQTARLIRRLRGDGLSLRAIAAELDRRGITPKRGRVWHAKVLRDIAARAA